VNPSLADLNHITFEFSGWAGISRFAMGEGFACAQTASGISCIGAAGTIMDLNRDTPTAVVGLDDPVVLDLVAGANHACALMADGSVRCWGDNASG